MRRRLHWIGLRRRPHAGCGKQVWHLKANLSDAFRPGGCPDSEDPSHKGRGCGGTGHDETPLELWDDREQVRIRKGRDAATRRTGTPRYVEHPSGRCGGPDPEEWQEAGFGVYAPSLASGSRSRLLEKRGGKRRG